MTDVELSAVTQDYLKAIWAAQEWSSDPVTTKQLSQRLGVGASTVSETVRRLADQGLVHHARYGAIALTDAGRTAALTQVRRHRLVETFLVEHLGYGWDEAHDDAEVLEHAVSARFIDRLDAALGHPRRDPHGDPIPDAAGRLPALDAVPLASLDTGQVGSIARISDADPQMLRYLAEVGLVLDQRVAVVERRDYAGTLSVQVADAETPVELGLKAAESVWVVADDG